MVQQSNTNLEVGGSYPYPWENESTVSYLSLQISVARENDSMYEGLSWGLPQVYHVLHNSFFKEHFTDSAFKYLPHLSSHEKSFQTNFPFFRI